MTVHALLAQHRPLGLHGFPEQLVPGPCQSPSPLLQNESVRRLQAVPMQHAPVWASAAWPGGNSESSAIETAMLRGRQRMVARVNISDRLSVVKTVMGDTVHLAGMSTTETQRARRKPGELAWFSGHSSVSLYVSVPPW